MFNKIAGLAIAGILVLVLVTGYTLATQMYYHINGISHKFTDENRVCTVIYTPEPLMDCRDKEQQK